MKADSTRTSVPWITTAPNTSGLARASSTSRASRYMSSGVMWGLGMLDQRTGLKSTPLRWGRNSPRNRLKSSLGTTPRSLARGRMVMVPPVKNMTILLISGILARFVADETTSPLSVCYSFLRVSAREIVLIFEQFDIDPIANGIGLAMPYISYSAFMWKSIVNPSHLSGSQHDESVYSEALRTAVLHLLNENKFDPDRTDGDNSINRWCECLTAMMTAACVFSNRGPNST